jgi:hypothetical protein
LVQNRSSRARVYARRRRLRLAGNLLLLVGALVTAYLVFLAMMKGR